ncbi:hypothetical protein MDA_GLEAN10017560 [Myotis davidii]|uniref:Uncharacterized protein n=1 Tax=Myotis davidii TaxID=225400 RepID=L5M1K0_MYODS|nr:hypothetical protein MDA_GLEAN10017560 [Myotis davidii]
MLPLPHPPWGAAPAPSQPSASGLRTVCSSASLGSGIKVVPSPAPDLTPEAVSIFGRDEGLAVSIFGRDEGLAVQFEIGISCSTDCNLISKIFMSEVDQKDYTFRDLESKNKKSKGNGCVGKELDRRTS